MYLVHNNYSNGYHIISLHVDNLFSALIHYVLMAIHALVFFSF